MLLNNDLIPLNAVYKQLNKCIENIIILTPLISVINLITDFLFRNKYTKIVYNTVQLLGNKISI